MLRWACGGNLGLGAAMDEVLLGKLHQEISVKLDVKLKVTVSGFSLLNVKIKSIVKKSDGFSLVALFAPFENCFKEGVI